MGVTLKKIPWRTKKCIVEGTRQLIDQVSQARNYVVTSSMEQNPCITPTTIFYERLPIYFFLNHVRRQTFASFRLFVPDGDGLLIFTTIMRHIFMVLSIDRGEQFDKGKELISNFYFRIGNNRFPALYLHWAAVRGMIASVLG